MLLGPDARSTGAKILSLPTPTSPPCLQPHHPWFFIVQARLFEVSPYVTSPCLTVLHFSISSRISGFTFSIMSTSCWLLFSIPLGITNTLVPGKDMKKAKWLGWGPGHSTLHPSLFFPDSWDAMTSAFYLSQQTLTPPTEPKRIYGLTNECLKYAQSLKNKEIKICSKAWMYQLLLKRKK